MGAGFFLLVALALLVTFLAWKRSPELPAAGIVAAGKMLNGVWLDIVLGFVIAGMVDVLLPSSAFAGWLTGNTAVQAIGVGWLAGLLIPGGPYVVFPLAGRLLQQGVAPGAIIAFITAKTLLSPIRMFTYEAPLLGWPMTLARFVPAVLMPPLLGYAGQLLYTVFSRE
jgi:uncharacterized membrane protein YraQ (UPF0718 family)